MLEFARELFLRVAPNDTAWCDTLESFLGGRTYKLTTQVSWPKQLYSIYINVVFSIRILYGDALATHYYGTITLLTALTNVFKMYWIHIDQTKNRVRSLHLGRTVCRISVC
jgi:hypothetical protein